MAGTFVRPRNVAWSSFRSWREMARTTFGLRCPAAVHHMDDTPSRYLFPSRSNSHDPCARSMTGKSSSSQAVCWVKGCQRTFRSRALHSALRERGDKRIDVLLVVKGGDRDPQAARPLRHRRRTDGGDEETLFPQVSRDVERALLGAHHDR